MTTFSVEIIYYLKILFEIIVPVLSYNSEPILKTGLVFAYELRFRRSIYANQSEKIFGSVRADGPACTAVPTQGTYDWKHACTMDHRDVRPVCA